MRTYFRTIVLFVLVALATIALPACATLGSAKDAALDTDYIKVYNYLILDYQGAQRATVDSKNCVVTAYTDINTQIGLANMAMQAEVARTAAYAGTIDKFFNTPSDKLGGKTPNQAIADANKTSQQQLAQYDDANGKALPSNQLDLAKLANAGALPSQLALTLNVTALTYTQAPLPPANFGPIENAQRVTSEKTNMLFACTKSSNDAIQKYNTDRNQVPGDIAGRLATYLKVSELPQQLPYFELQGPTQVQPVPTFGIPK